MATDDGEALQAQCRALQLLLATPVHALGLGLGGGGSVGSRRCGLLTADKSFMAADVLKVRFAVCNRIYLTLSLTVFCTVLGFVGLCV